MSNSSSVIPLALLISQLSEHASDGASSSSSSPLSSEAVQGLSDELLALQAIYAPDEEDLRVVGLEGAASQKWTQGTKIRLELKLPLDLPVSGPDSLRLSITIPPTYPAMSLPQLQLLDRFIGPYEVDSGLFGQVLRTLKSGENQGEVLFEACENVKEKVEEWYKVQETRRVERERKDGRGVAGSTISEAVEEQKQPISSSINARGTPAPSRLQLLARSKKWTSTEAVLDRKSTFIGHAIQLTESSEVPHLLSMLLDLYPKLSKATHPFMRAWVCTDSKTGTVERDNDDDGENAAGGRLAHLLDMLHCDNVLVVVSRWYGGIHLGSDRFKLINRVARDALEIARLIPAGNAGKKK